MPDIAATVAGILEDCSPFWLGRKDGVFDKILWSM